MAGHLILDQATLVRVQLREHCPSWLYGDFMQHFQVQLSSGSTVRTCWLREGVRVGDRVTLKNSEDPDQTWDVTWVGSEGRELDEINRGWHNNI